MLKFEGGQATVTVHQVRSEWRLSSPPDNPGTRWAGIDAEWCFDRLDAQDGSTVTLTWDAWALLDGQNRRYQAFTSGSSPAFPRPGYPREEELSVGECARGWVMVPVLKDAKLAVVRYAPGQGRPLLWDAGT